MSTQRPNQTPSHHAMRKRKLIAGLFVLFLCVSGTILVVRSRTTGAPKLAVHFLRYEHENGTNYAVCCMTNIGAVPLTCWGSRPASPFYSLSQHLFLTGGWKSSPHGTDNGGFRLDVGSSRLFRVYPLTNATWNVTLYYYAVLSQDRAPSFMRGWVYRRWPPSRTSLRAESPRVDYGIRQ